ncbi:MAG: hypothetical protein ABI600_15850 [Luteolibacter sp.]
MSRRSRRNNPTAGGGWFGKIIVGSLILALLAAGVGYAMLRSYLHSDSFRKFLSAEVSDVAGVTGEFALFRWEGLALETDSFEAKGAGVVTGLRADGLHAEVGFGGVGRGVWEIKGSSLKRLDVSVDATKTVEEKLTAEVRRDSKKTAPKSSWLPKDAELQVLDVGDVSVNAALEEGPATASGMRLHLEPGGAKNAYRAEVRGGTIHMPFKVLPEIRLDRLRLRYQNQRVFLTDATVLAWKSGRIEGSGEWDMDSRQYTLEGVASGLTCEDIFSETWAKRFTGDVASSFSMDNSSSSPTARGKLTIQSGVITALPMLDALAAYADTRRFRVLNLNEAHTDWRWKKGELALTNFVLSSDGLVRLEGSLTIRGRELDGLFRLGLAPGTLATIPGAETDVFIAGERGLLWTPLRITGTLDDPKEDLTDRLITAAGLRMFDQIPETGEKVIKFTRSVIGDDPKKAVDKGVKIIEKGTGIIRDASGILDGFLGGDGGDEKPKNERK